MVATPIVVAMLCLLTLATSAQAECAWVLWQRIDTFDARRALVSAPPEVRATYTTSAECITAIDELERRRDTPQTVVQDV
jgi:hypothetical protein